MARCTNGPVVLRCTYKLKLAKDGSYRLTVFARNGIGAEFISAQICETFFGP